MANEDRTTCDVDLEKDGTSGQEIDLETTAEEAPETAETVNGTETAAGETGSSVDDTDADEETNADKAEDKAGDEDKEEESKGLGRRLSRRDKKALEKKDEQIAQLTDQWRRSMAEFDNFRKRTEKEKAAMYGMGVKDVVEKILPVIDNFERGLATVTTEMEDDKFVQGIRAIYKQFMTTLEALEVRPIEAVGKPFDPDFHNAVMHVEDESLGDNVVAEEFQKGYLYKDIVIRHSMVKVAN